MNSILRTHLWRHVPVYILDDLSATISWDRTSGQWYGVHCQKFNRFSWFTEKVHFSYIFKDSKEYHFLLFLMYSLAVLLWRFSTFAKMISRRSSLRNVFIIVKNYLQLFKHKLKNRKQEPTTIDWILTSALLYTNLRVWLYMNLYC